ncbi:hypothetical protein GLOIN_2v1147490 [Rhizophagus clarus]|uniref:Uncharacterized protein n=1 Tax=Rhizophagus clarus TaxID=94130 RepID=A0A8H3MBM0_9GLOM|nr:hypothetical protein GLOIN_2v1147490 [Rhizophagus clarus]
MRHNIISSLILFFFVCFVYSQNVNQNINDQTLSVNIRDLLLSKRLSRNRIVKDTINVSPDIRKRDALPMPQLAGGPGAPGAPGGAKGAKGKAAGKGAKAPGAAAERSS